MSVPCGLSCFNLISFSRCPFAGVVVQRHFVLGNPAAYHGARIENLFWTQRKVDVSRRQGYQCQGLQAVQKKHQSQRGFWHAVGTFPYW